MIQFHIEEEPLEGSFEEVVAASRPATPVEAKRFGLLLKRGRFSRYVRIITKDVVLPPYYGAQSSTVFLVPSGRTPVVTLADWKRKTGHGFVILEDPEEMEWFATRMFKSVAVADFRYYEYSEEGRAELKKIAHVLFMSRYRDPKTWQGMEL